MISTQGAVLALWVLSSCSLAFIPNSPHVIRQQQTVSRTQQSLVVLEMAKKMRNKQAELAKKMAMAKEQAKKEEQGGSGTVAPDKPTKLTDEEIKAKNDRRRFEQLLKSQSSAVLNDYSSSGYLNKKQEEEEIRAVRK